MAPPFMHSAATLELKTSSPFRRKIHSMKQSLRPLYMRLPIYKPLAVAKSWLEFHLRADEPESQLMEEAQRYWNQDSPILPQNLHWRGAGIFSDDRWLAWGQEHLRIYQDFARMLGVQSSVRRIVEWGCGGGANAVHFASLAKEFVGVDVSRATLDECSRQLSRGGFTNFIPVLIDATDPESASVEIPEPCDLFICFGVFELFPTPEYGYRVLSVARDLLAKGGLAIIQIRYMGKSWETKPHRFHYHRFVGRNVTYTIDGFWLKANELGFTPRAITLIPHHPVNDQTNYAYFMLSK